MKTGRPTPQVTLFRVNGRGEAVLTIEGLKWLQAIFDDLNAVYASLEDHETRITALEP